MYIFEIIAERKIQQAIVDGEFDNLQGKGKPLADDGREILKNSGIAPEEIELKKSIFQLNDLLNTCVDEAERKQIRAKLNEKQLRYNLIMESRGLKRIDIEYMDKIQDRLK